jgi:hypothetical protein
LGRGDVWSRCRCNCPWHQPCLGVVNCHGVVNNHVVARPCRAATFAGPIPGTS